MDIFCKAYPESIRAIDPELLYSPCAPEATCELGGAIVTSTSAFASALMPKISFSEATALACSLDALDGVLDGFIMVHESCLNRRTIEGVWRMSVDERIVETVANAFRDSGSACIPRPKEEFYREAAKIWYEGFRRNAVTVAVQAQDPNLFGAVLAVLSH